MINLQLPYNPGDLGPSFSEKGILAHYEQFRACASNLNVLSNVNIIDRINLTTLIKISRGPLQFNAIQVWNHAFYFSGLKPGGSKLGNGPLKFGINGCFGSVASFRDLFIKYGMRGESSGWMWLAVKADGVIEIIRDHGSKHPILKGYWPIFNCDLWDHAFHTDFGTDRKSYIDAVLKLADWEIIEIRYQAAIKQVSKNLLLNPARQTVQI